MRASHGEVGVIQGQGWRPGAQRARLQHAARACFGGGRRAQARREQAGARSWRRKLRPQTKQSRGMLAQAAHRVREQRRRGLADEALCRRRDVRPQRCHEQVQVFHLAGCRAGVCSCVCAQRVCGCSLGGAGDSVCDVRGGGGGRGAQQAKGPGQWRPGRTRVVCGAARMASARPRHLASRAARPARASSQPPAPTPAPQYGTGAGSAPGARGYGNT